jgi:hypothetical protein
LKDHVAWPVCNYVFERGRTARTGRRRQNEDNDRVCDAKKSKENGCNATSSKEATP